MNFKLTCEQVREFFKIIQLANRDLFEKEIINIALSEQARSIYKKLHQKMLLPATKKKIAINFTSSEVWCIYEIRNQFLDPYHQVIFEEIINTFMSKQIDNMIGATLMIEEKIETNNQSEGLVSYNYI